MFLGFNLETPDDVPQNVPDRQLHRVNLERGEVALGQVIDDEVQAGQTPVDQVLDRHVS